MLAIFKALFGGLGLKDYVYGAILLAGVVFASWYTIHERNLGAATFAAKEAKLAAAERQHNLDLQAIAALQQQKAGDKLDETLHTPVVDAPVVRLCREPGPHNVPAAPAAGLPGDSNPPPTVVGSEVALDPNAGTLIVTVGRDDDAEVAYLLSVIDALRAEMRGAK